MDLTTESLQKNPLTLNKFEVHLHKAINKPTTNHQPPIFE
jgi:hypothetical protein